VVAALEANEATGDPLPVQVHCGFGDADLHLWRSDPSHLKPLVERFRETSFVLLHCYPYVREAGWLAHVYGNVWFDLSLTIPHVSQPAQAIREALELAPVSKLLYASDAARTPELYYLAALVAAGARRRAARADPRRGRGGGGAADPARKFARPLPALSSTLDTSRVQLPSEEEPWLPRPRRRAPSGRQACCADSRTS
jgi:hypothetical protein